MTIIEQLRTQIKEVEAKIAAIQAECNHPLLVREHKNHGSGGDPDERTYWTNHHCTLCGLRWQTGQRWNYEGDCRGMPEQEENADG